MSKTDNLRKMSGRIATALRCGNHPSFLVQAGVFLVLTLLLLGLSRLTLWFLMGPHDLSYDVPVGFGILLGGGGMIAGIVTGALSVISLSIYFVEWIQTQRYNTAP